MEELLTRKDLMAVLRLKGDNAIMALERQGLPYLFIGNRKRYRPGASVPARIYAQTAHKLTAMTQPDRKEHSL